MIRFFSRHPTAANLLMLALIMVGLTSLSKIKRETFPDFVPPYLIASIVYPGATPLEVEQTLCQRMEDAIDGLDNIVEARCEALEGIASMIIKLTNGDIVPRMLVDVQTQINSINDFPAETESPIVRELDKNDPVVDVAIQADMPLPELKAYAESLKRILKVDYGVSLVEVSDFSDHQIRVELDTAAVRRLGMSVADVSSTLASQNIKLPGGNLELSDRNYLVRFDGQQVDPEGLGNIVVGADSDGSVVQLKDIANITNRFELDEQKLLFDGMPATVLKISKNKADDSLRVKDKVAAFVDAANETAPTGVTLTLTNDQSSMLWDRLTMILNNGWQGVLLVFAVMWLFFTFRYSFWVAAGLPVAFLGSLYLMVSLGLSINIMTLAALLMAIGIMMDDAIVISESIAAHIDRGQQVKDAVYNGVSKVFPGVLSSYLTTVCIFGSLMFLEGEMGAVLKVVPMVLLLVLTLSLVEAFLILPNHLSHSLEKSTSESEPPRWKKAFFNRFENFRNNQLMTSVEWAVRWRYLFVGGVVGLLIASISLLASGTLKFVGFPQLDGDIAEARIILPPGSTLSQTEHIVEQVVLAAKRVDSQYTNEVEGGEPLVRHITEQYNVNGDADESGSHIATVRLDLLSAEVRKSLMADVLSDWEKETGELAAPVSLVFKQPSLGPGGKDVELRIQHDDLSVLKEASIDIQAFLAQFQGVSGVIDDMRLGKPELKISLRAGAENYGVNGQMVATQLRAAYFGQTADEIQVGPENIKIQVMLDKQQAGDLSELKRFPVTLANGSHVPLSMVATIEYQRNFVRIQRIDGFRTVTVSADLNQSVISSNELLEQFKKVELPKLRKDYPGLRVNFEGSARDMAAASNSMLTGFLLGVFGVFVILSFQFRSYLEPAVVLVTIPLAFIGVLWGHLLLGHPMSLPGMLGFVSLAGVVVNDSILLVQYIRQHLNDGESLHDAVVFASRERFRAVFLTSITTAAGLLPLLLETSLQAEIIKPLVISIVFGIFTSTLLVLFMIPAAYAILGDFGLVKAHHRQVSAVDVSA